MRAWQILIGLLLSWKVVRTDWVLVVPYWVSEHFDSGWGGRTGTFNKFLHVGVSPLWSPPSPQAAKGKRFEKWETVVQCEFVASGAQGPSGEPCLRPNWLLMGVKVGTISLFAFVSVRVVNALLNLLCRMTWRYQNYL